MRCNDVLNNTSRPLSRLYDEYCNLLLTVALDPVEWSPTKTQLNKSARAVKIIPRGTDGLQSGTGLK